MLKKTDIFEKYKVNERIKARKVRLIDEDKNLLGIFSIEEALAKAKLAELDLIEISDKVSPPICKILDFGKFKYLDRKRLQKIKKQQQVHRKLTITKEIKFKPKIDEHDFQFKKNRAIAFLKEGLRVKVNMIYNVRELYLKEIGLKFLSRFKEELQEVGKVESETEGGARNRIISIIFIPSKKLNE